VSCEAIRCISSDLTRDNCHSQAKIALKCDSEEDLQLLQASAQSLGVCARSIQDA
jgi:peptidyl-tRNA hydrolase